MNRKYKLKFYVRPALAITFAFVGVYIAGIGIPLDITGGSRVVILSVAGAAFAVLGFILPELVELIGRAGITAIAMQIMRELPREATLRLPQGRMAHLPMPQFTFSARHESLSGGFKSPIVVDTSVFVDGRVLDIAKSGFLSGELLVIPSVISELQMLADSASDLKRARGRRGLDVIADLKKTHGVTVRVLDEEPSDGQVDSKLVTLARKLRAKVMTTDFNLNKVARARNVAVLNINDLANAVKSKVLPGEELEIDIKAVGKAKDQGVGYLEDGTMVVVEGGAGMKGKSLTVRVMKVLQTAAGRMIFSRPKGE